jgi:tetratricopeptide (TPR) repeat protein
MQAAHERYARQAELGRAAGDAEAEAEGEYYGGEALLVLGRNEEAKLVLARSVETCRRFGFRRTEARAMSDLALAWFVLGRYVDARSGFERALELADELGFLEGAALTHANFAMLLTFEGDLEEAERHVERHRVIALEIASPFHLAYSTLYRGEIWRQQGRGDECDRELRTALELFDNLGFHLGVLDASLHLGRMLAVEGRTAEAVPYFERAEVTATVHGLLDPAPLPTFYLALLGERPVDGLIVPDSMQLPLALEGHWILSRAGAASVHEERAKALLERLSAHLRGADLERFRRVNPIARDLLNSRGAER